MNYEGMDEEALNRRASLDACTKEEMEFIVFADSIEKYVEDKLRTSTGNMIPDKQLDHLQKFDILEVERYPIHWTDEMVQRAVANSRWIDLGVEMRIITIGQFRSLLVPM